MGPGANFVFNPGLAKANFIVVISEKVAKSRVSSSDGEFSLAFLKFILQLGEGKAEDGKDLKNQHPPLSQLRWIVFRAGLVLCGWLGRALNSVLRAVSVLGIE